MARLLVNKHFNDHESAKNGFSQNEEHIFGEIIICNDSVNPSIYIKDSEKNSVAIGDVLIESEDMILTKENRTIKSTIGLSWDETASSIKLIGKDKAIISEIPIFGEETIGKQIDDTITRIVEVNSILTDSVNLPEGTEEGKSYIEIKVRENGAETVKYVEYLTPDTLFSIEGKDVVNTTDVIRGTEGEVVVEFNEETNKYIVSHGSVDFQKTNSTTNSFGTTEFVKDIKVNNNGHILSVTTGKLPSLPSHKVKINSSTGETETDYYVSSVSQNTDDLAFDVEYTKFPEVKVTISETEEGSKTTKFVSDIKGTNSEDIKVTYSDVDLDSYAQKKDLADYVDNNELETRLKNLGLINPDGSTPEIAITVNNEDCGEGKYVSNIVVDETDKTKLHIHTAGLGLNKYVAKSEVSQENNNLEWDTNITLATVGDATISAKLPAKPGVKVSDDIQETSEYVLVSVSTGNTEVNEITFGKKEIDINNLMYKKDVVVPTTASTLQWPEEGNANATKIATIGGQEINVILPNPVNIEVGEPETVVEVSEIISDITTTGHTMTLHKGTVNFKNFVTNETLAGKHYLDANSIDVITGETAKGITTFVKSVKAAPTNDNKLDLELEFGEVEQFNIDNEVQYEATPQLKWGDAADGADGVSIVKIGNKDIKVKLPNEPKVDVDSKIVTYDIDSSIEGNKVTVSLKGYEGGEEKNGLDKATSLIIPFVSSGEVNTYVSLNKTTDDNNTDNQFIKDITVNGTEITPIFGEVPLEFDVIDNNVTLTWGERKEIAKINGTPIHVTTLVPEKGEGADGNTKYELSGGEISNKQFKIELTSRDGSDEASNVTVNLSDFTTTSDVEGIVSKNLENAGEVKDVQVDNTSVVVEGIAKIDLSSYVKDGDLPNFNEFAKENDLPNFEEFALKSEIPDLEGFASADALNKKQDSINDLDTIRANASSGATAYNWGNHADVGYLTSASLNGYATQKFVEDKNYLTSASLEGYATQTWVGEQGYLTSASLDGYATTAEVNKKQDAITDLDTIRNNAASGATAYNWGNHADVGYLTSASLEGYATQKFVEDKNYATEAYVIGEIAKAQLTPGEVTIPVTDVKVNGNSVVNNFIAEIDLKGYSETGHKHVADDITGGTFNIARIPTGETSDTVAIGSHTHSGYASIDALNKKQNVINDLDTIINNASSGATAYNWGNHADAGYLTSASLEGYATQKFVEDKNYITSASLNGYATQKWVGEQGYLTSASLNGYATTADLNKKQNVINDLDTIINNAASGATAYSWGNHADVGYLTSASLEGYATQKFVEDKNYITSASLNGYATQKWVGEQGYLTSASLNGYATTADLNKKQNVINDLDTIRANASSGATAYSWGNHADVGYLTSASLNGYATQKFVEDKNYLTSASLEGYATQTWVGEQGYLTSASLNGYATTADLNKKQDAITDLDTIRNNAASGATAYNWGNHADAGYLTSASLNGYATQKFVEDKNYLTSASLEGYATQTWVGEQGYLTSASLNGYATTAELNKKQDAINDLTNIRNNAASGVTAYGWGNHADVGYLTSSSLNGYATQKWVEDKKYITGYTDSATTYAGHYDPSKETTSAKDASNGTLVDITDNATQVLKGINVDGKGHVVSVNSIALNSTDTHYTSLNVVTSTNTDTKNAQAENGKVSLNHVENGEVTSSHLIKGATNITVTADTTGTITITGPNLSGYSETGHTHSEYAPKDHASSEATYGLATNGTSAQYGHVKLVNGDLADYKATSSYSNGVAAAAQHTHSQYLTGYTEQYKGTVTSVKVTGGTGLSGGNTITGSGTITLNHAAAFTGTSLGSTDGYIQTLTMDGLGHVTAVATGTPTDTKVTTTVIGSSNTTASTSANTFYLAGSPVQTATTASLLKNPHVYITKGGAYSTLVTPMLEITGGGGTGNTEPYTSLKVNTPENIYFGGTGLNLAELIATMAPSSADEKVKSSTSTDRMYLLGSTSSGTVTTMAYKHASVYAENGTMYADAYYQTSDERLKDFHGDIEVDFEKLKNIPKKYFTWKADENSELELGTSAQKLLEVYPELVSSGEENKLTVDYARLSIVALKAIDKLHEENMTLRNELNEIKKHLGL